MTAWLQSKKRAKTDRADGRDQCELLLVEQRLPINRAAAWVAGELVREQAWPASSCDWPSGAWCEWSTGWCLAWMWLRSSSS